jgi:superfamily I DNA and/or RNA helicase
VLYLYYPQVYKIKAWLLEQNYNKIDVGTVESFQGKEKRVILVSTVRANNKLLDYDAKYGLGFLVDDKVR